MSDIQDLLLAEDNPNDVELVLSALEERQLANRVKVVHDGAEALEYLFRKGRYSERPPENPIVMMLDLKMPKVDGLEVLRRIRADELLKMLPVVVLTSSREERDVIESYKLGANSYVVKPVVFEEFVRAVGELGVFWAMVNEPPPRRS